MGTPCYYSGPGLGARNYTFKWKIKFITKLSCLSCFCSNEKFPSCRYRCNFTGSIKKGNLYLLAVEKVAFLSFDIIYVLNKP